MMQNILKNKAHTHFLHKTGMFLSVLCLIHCISMPFILLLTPYFGSKFLDHDAEKILILGSLALAVFLQTKDYKTHRNLVPLLLLLLAGSLFSLIYLVLPENMEVYLSPVASGIMAVSFFLNWRLHRQTCSSHKH